MWRKAQLLQNGEAMGDVDDEQDGVAGLQRVMDLLHHAAVEVGVGLVNAGGIDEDELGGGVAFRLLGLFEGGQLQDAEDAVAGGLGLVGDDGELLAEKRVEERGLAGVGTADDGDETRAERHPFYYAPGGLFHDAALT